MIAWRLVIFVLIWIDDVSKTIFFHISQKCIPCFLIGFKQIFVDKGNVIFINDFQCPAVFLFKAINIDLNSNVVFRKLLGQGGENEIGILFGHIIFQKRL